MAKYHRSAPITGQGDAFFAALKEWELCHLPADYFGDTRPVDDTEEVTGEETTETFTGWDTRRLPTVHDCGDVE